jgi:cyanophycinase
MIVAGGDDAEMQTGRVPTVGGLGLWRGVIVDEHFVSKKRFNKLMAAVIDHPQFVGVGIDEATGVVFDGSTIRVVGEGNVVVLDARHATVNPSRPGDASSATGVEMQVLAGGMSYELVKR